MKTKIFENYEEFLLREDKTVNGVSREYAESNPNYAEDNETNVACWNCRDCRDCQRCRTCRYSLQCKDLHDLEYDEDADDCEKWKLPDLSI